MARCCVRAHPRSRGENEHPLTLTCRPGGSSPLTRGKRFEGLAVDGRAGLIPAHAGKTASLKWRSLPTAAHPRSRGENRFHDRCRGHADWLIPAHAGKTGLKPPKTSRDTAHPRSRGENYVVFTPGVGQSGSSPLTRGKPTLTLRSVMSVRLIPAHAGKTRSCTRRTRGRWAHPRSRGENDAFARAFDLAVGSSPLTRGKPSGCRTAPGRRRLIPAHAGKTGVLSVVHSTYSAHPRSRGENLIGAVRTFVVTGSSPLTRGKLALIVPSTSCFRLIPAHAGKTTSLFDSLVL